jgi:hypothetical protein
MSLEGNLTDFTLPDLFQLLGLGKRTGCLEIHKNDKSGKIFFDEGMIVYARANGIRNENAVYEMFSWQNGEFEFLINEQPPQKPINLDWQNIILEAARRVDEITEIKKSIPDYDAILKLVDEENSNIDNINLSNNDLKLLSLVNGKRTVNEVIKKSGMDKIEASKKLVSYKKANLIDIDMSDQERIEQTKKKIKKSNVKGAKKLFGFLFGKRKKKYAIPHNAVGLITEMINMLLDYFEMNDPVISLNYNELSSKIDELKAIYPDMENVFFSKDANRINTDRIEWIEGAETKSILEGLNEILEFVFETARTNNPGEDVLGIYQEVYQEIVKIAGQMELSREATLALKYIPKR